MRNTLMSLCLFSSLIISNQLAAQFYPSKKANWEPQLMKPVDSIQPSSAFNKYPKLGFMSTGKFASLALNISDDGYFKLKVDPAKAPFGIAVFKVEGEDIEASFNAGTALLVGYANVESGKSFVLESGDLAPELMQMLKGQQVLIVARNEDGSGIKITPELSKSKSLPARSKVVSFDFRKNKTGSSLTVSVRDSITGLPVKAKVVITGLKGIDNSYNASDLMFNAMSGKKGIFTVDADGYFKAEINPRLDATKNTTLTILLVPFDISKNIHLEGVQFVEGTTEPLHTAYRDMDKLVEFLKTHEELKIEVQGHVNAPDKGSRAAQKLSLMRAQYVADYLISKGIAASRITYEGYGNTKMIYENPKTPEEEQANRRVEIRFIQE